MTQPRSHLKARFGALSIGFIEGGGWSRGVSCAPSQDTALFHRLHRALWRALWRAGPPATVATVGVHLGNVALLQDRPGELFARRADARRARGCRRGPHQPALRTRHRHLGHHRAPSGVLRARLNGPVHGHVLLTGFCGS